MFKTVRSCLNPKLIGSRKTKSGRRGSIYATRRVRPVNWRRRKRDIGRVTAASDGNASNPWHIMARVEGKPAPIQKDFEPRIIIHRSWIRRHPDVAQKAIGVTRRNVHAAAESDGEVRKIAADAHTLVVGFICGASGAGMFTIG